MPIPLRGDRAAHDDINYPELHAADLEAGAPLHHLPYATLDTVPVFNGVKWMAQSMNALREKMLFYFSSLVNGQVLVVLNGKFVNKSLVDAGIAPAVHTHDHTHETGTIIPELPLGLLENGVTDAPEIIFANGDEITIWETL